MNEYKNFFRILDSNKKHEELENYLIDFKDINDPVKIDESQHVYETIAATQMLIRYLNERVKCTELLTKYNAIEKFLILFEHLCQKRKEINFKDCRELIEPVSGKDMCYQTTSLNERRIFNLVYLETIFNYVLLSKITFLNRFTIVNENKSTYLKTYLDFLNDLEFMKNFNQFYSKGMFILNLGIIVKGSDESLDKWQELNAINIVLEYGRLFKEYYLDVYNIISYIATDKNIENLTEINEILDKYIQFTIKSVTKPDGKTKSTVNDSDGCEKSFQINYILDEFGFTTPAIFFIRCLYRLSVNDAIKLKIFKWPNLKENLKNYVFNVIDIEKQAVLQLFSQLAFNLEINSELNNDSEFISYIEELSKRTNFEFKKLEKTVKELLFVLKNKTTNDQHINVGSSHIMISYNTASRELCLQMKQELEKLNYKVWIDINEIHGSSLDSMAKAVEQASCVLICVTEKYRQSVNCQAEAQYAFKLNKIIIPCIMQQGYNNISGWLGIIMGDKIFIDFTKYRFEEAFKRLIKQIELNQGDNSKLVPIKTKETNQKPPSNDVNSKLPANWTNIEVENWFTNNNIKTIFNFLAPINGKDLLQLYEIKVNVPEFFFKSLTKHEPIEIKEVMIFSKLLVDLFKK